jgi:hypothetical protein
VDLDAAGKIETPLDGRVDDGDLFKSDHRRCDPSYVRVNVWLDISEISVRMTLWV